MDLTRSSLQTTSFLTNKVPVVGVGVGGVTLPGSLTQVVPLPGCVHIVFLHSCSYVLSHPLCIAACLHFWTVYYNSIITEL
jgi:hypothetical protein